MYKLLLKFNIKVITYSLQTSHFIALHSVFAFFTIEGKTLHQQEDYNSLKAQIMVSIF